MKQNYKKNHKKVYKKMALLDDLSFSIASKLLGLSER